MRLCSPFFVHSGDGRRQFRPKEMQRLLAEICKKCYNTNIPLGNILRQELDEILASPRARAIYDGFSRGQAVEELCRGCGYANRF